MCVLTHLFFKNILQRVMPTSIYFEREKERVMTLQQQQQQQQQQQRTDIGEVVFWCRAKNCHELELSIIPTKKNCSRFFLLLLRPNLALNLFLPTFLNKLLNKVDRFISEKIKLWLLNWSIFAQKIMDLDP